MDVVHVGFDGLRFSVEAAIPADLRETLIGAKLMATRRSAEVHIEWNGLELMVRSSGGMKGFSVHTGDHGAEWWLSDPENPPRNTPGVRADFRAFGLAEGGLAHAREHFDACMEAFGVRYEAHQVKVSRVDIAVDIIAPGFEPERRCIVAPPNTKSRDRAQVSDTQEHGVAERTGSVSAGHVSNRQVTFYDKTKEVQDARKPGWYEVWNARRAADSLPPLSRDMWKETTVWRIEARVGTKQLRNKWELRGWEDLDHRIGDVFAHFCEKVTYRQPTRDSNRSRWPIEPIWNLFSDEVARFLSSHRLRVGPSEAREANRAEYVRGRMESALGALVGIPAAEGCEPDEFEDFVRSKVSTLIRMNRHHPRPIDERIAATKSKYIFR